MLKRVLVPLDRADNSEEVLKAIPGFCDKDDEIVLLSIAEPVGPTRSGTRPGRILRGSLGPGVAVISVDLPEYVETTDQALHRQLDELEDYLSPKAKALEEQGYNVSTALEVSEDPTQTIVDVARQMKPTFIVMVRTMDPGIGERMFGTVARHVIDAGVSPVMMLPSHAQ